MKVFPHPDDFMSENDLTVAAQRIRASVDWQKLPKLAAIFEHRPSSNVYWHELVIIVLKGLQTQQ